MVNSTDVFLWAHFNAVFHNIEERKKFSHDQYPNICKISICIDIARYVDICKLK